MSKIKDDYIKEKFGMIKFGEESSIPYIDFERSLNSYLKDKGTPRYSHYMTQKNSKGKFIDDFEEGFEEFFK
ncbi:MAG: hypothetical protein ACFFBP_14245 [Promethearchaeota archaeon]